MNMSHWLAVTEKSIFYSPTFVGFDPIVGWVLIDFFGQEMTSMEFYFTKHKVGVRLC